MKFLPVLVTVALSVQVSSAFTVSPHRSSGTCMTRKNNSPLKMGLFDFFSADAKREREARKEAEIEEQERLQREIIARRNNPERMDEYEAKIRVRRRLRMAGDDGKAEMIETYGEEDIEITGLN
mmetsp:Transcript_27309/g.54642  ORF Transcript_27309/g.54642 Transcript_27309/m.54642 type:complete len:124 (+) Transcript_27309:158-529(+)|eukprot:CAMPEP_0194309986 /NCGR_PEP_ID=MMETSP0171-20130528/6945_1 /TAXON_ID=218684 /ORGANISM="Corethron pennatum, Strain L29A3" /LENGTH=123 /DNA_ID=CAMNT_0039063395 /DNA_START=115 /DNA_END=486 /DNA_ORIENTATION=-